MLNLIKLLFFTFVLFYPGMVLANNYHPHTPQLSDNVKLITKLFHDFFTLHKSGFGECSKEGYSLYNPRSACNIAVIEALNKIYGNDEFKLMNKFLLANQLYDYFSKNADWTEIGTATSQLNLYKAQCLANTGIQVVAVSKGEPYGHVALIMPGTLEKSGTLRKWYPNMMSFFLDRPHNAKIARGINWGWSACKMSQVKLYFRNKGKYTIFETFGIADQKRNCDVIPEPNPFLEDRSELFIKIKEYTQDYQSHPHVYIQGFVSIKSDDLLKSVQALVYNIPTEKSYSTSVSLTERKDPNIICWNAYLPLGWGNQLTFIAETTNGSESNRILINAVRIGSDSSNKAGRKIASASVSGSEPHVTCDKVTFITGYQLTISGIFIYNDTIGDTYWSPHQRGIFEPLTISTVTGENSKYKFEIPSINIPENDDNIVIDIMYGNDKKVHSFNVDLSSDPTCNYNIPMSKPQNFIIYYSDFDNIHN